MSLDRSASDSSALSGRALIDAPLFNKGTAFTEEERVRLRLLGLLPPHVETLDEQTARAYEAFKAEPNDLARHVYLRQIQDENETLFYRLMLDHIHEMMPIIYTPVVGEACQKFSHIYRRPRGLFISYPERDQIDAILDNVDCEIDVIVVTDGERILGLGDQGAGGMGIPIGKLSLYTLCGGVDPARTLPILLDLGTNNQERLDDPRYVGWRHARIKGEEYDAFIERFVQAVERRFPKVLLQWEDFASVDAEPILQRYRDRLCTFNDDIQGTASVTTGTLLAAVAATGEQLTDMTFLMLGAGSAGVGIVQQMIQAMMHEGLSEEAARQRCLVVDAIGLLHEGRSDLNEIHRRIAQLSESISDWDCDPTRPIPFEAVMRNARPTILVGATGQRGAFTEPIIREMARHAERPIIFPLSNPTSRAEAVPSDLFSWTEGRAIVATGSPFEPVAWEGRSHTIAQCNNSYIFPAMGLAVLASGACRVTDAMFMAAAMALKDKSPALADPDASLLPPLENLRAVSRHIAHAVAVAAQKEGVAEVVSSGELSHRIETTMWSPEYV